MCPRKVTIQHNNFDEERKCMACLHLPGKKALCFKLMTRMCSGQKTPEKCLPIMDRVRFVENLWREICMKRVTNIYYRQA